MQIFQFSFPQIHFANMQICILWNTEDLIAFVRRELALLSVQPSFSWGSCGAEQDYTQQQPQWKAKQHQEKREDYQTRDGFH